VLTAAGALADAELTSTGVAGVCHGLAGLLPVDGVAVTVTTGPPAAGGGARRVLLGASDSVAWRWELAELTAGVGPGTQAATTGCTVAVDDLDAHLARWPGLGEQLTGVGIGAVAAIPLRAGHTLIGSLDTYRADPHQWAGAELTAIAGPARVVGLGLAAGSAADPDDTNPDGADSTGPGLLDSSQVDFAQATGMVMGALGLSAADAASRLRAAAFVQGQLITAVAGDILTGRLPPTLA